MIPRHFLIVTGVLFALAIAMAVYVWELRRRETLAPIETRTVQPIAPPASGRTESVTFWVAYDAPAQLRPQSASVPLSSGRQQRAQELMRFLLEIYKDKNSSHRMAPDAQVRDVYLVDAGTAVLDVNASFAGGHTSGVLAEELTIASLVQTLSASIPGLTRVKILVDGKERPSL